MLELTTLNGIIHLWLSEDINVLATVIPCLLLHTMVWFYVIYRYVISKWRSIRLVEINQYDITMATHDITMGNDIARDAHCEITMGNDVARDIHCDITMSNDIAMCTYHGITMHYNVAMNLFYYVFSDLCLVMILLWVVCNKNKNKFMFIQSGSENTWVVFVEGYFTRPSDSWNISTQTQLMCFPQTYQTLTCSCYTAIEESMCVSITNT